MNYEIIELNDLQLEDIEMHLYEYEEVGSYENKIDGFSEYFFLKPL